MAKVYGPLHSMQASGRVGSLVYARNQHGAYSRPYVVPTNPDSSEQQEWRSNMASIISSWENDTGITTARRLDWEAFARTHPVPDRLGNPRTLSARDWFVRCNIFRVRAGLGLRDGPPTSPTSEYVPDISLSQEADGIHVNVDIPPILERVIYASYVPNQNHARNFMPHNTTHGFIAANTSDTDWLCIPNAVIEGYDKRQFIKVRIIDLEGIPSPPRILYLDTDVSPSPVDIVPAFDTYISDQNPNTNFENSTDFRVRTYGGENLHSLLFFDMSSIPAGRTIDTVTLNAYASSTNNYGDVGCFEILVESVPTELTWLFKSTGNIWASPGMQSGTDYNATAEDTITISAELQFYSWDITSLATEWYLGLTAQYGVVLRGDVDVGTFVFRSIESGTPSEFPYLHVTFS